MDCFAALAMTKNADATSRSRGAMRPRFAINLRPEIKGRGECRAPDAPAASCALWVTSMHTSIHSEPPEITRHSRTQWFTAYTALSPVIGFLATVVSGVASANLMPASGHQDHTSSPSAFSALVRSTARVHRIPPRVRDVRETPLCGTGRREYKSDLGRGSSGISENQKCAKMPRVRVGFAP
jgi:hypothetical protein